MRFEPIEGEFWIIEMDNGTDDPDYYRRFDDELLAHAWANARAERWVIINVLPPGRHYEADLADDDKTVETPGAEPSA
jgi:hypothetical protein